MTAAGVSVIICAYTDQRLPDLLTALAAVEDQTAPPAETIVVIDHNAALLARLRALLVAYPGVTATDNTGARGLSGARNSGVALARGEVIAFLDDDAVPAPDWLATLVTAYDTAGAERVWGVGGAIVPDWPGERPRWFPPEFDWVVGCTYRGAPGRAAPVRNLIGANMSFRRDVFAAVGGFRTGMGRLGTTPLGCEETELCIRLRQRHPDALLCYEPRARVRHRVTPERARPRYFWSRCWAEGRSKALVTRLAGADAGLATERAYTRHVLPRGVARELATTLRGVDPAGAARAAAIVVGLAVTAAGYLAGLLARDRTSVGGNLDPASPAPGVTLTPPAPSVTAEVP